MHHLAWTSVALTLFTMDGFAQSGRPASLAPPPRTVLTNPTDPPQGTQGLWLGLTVSELYDRNNLTPAAPAASQSGTPASTIPVYLRSGFRTRGNAHLNYAYAKQGNRSSFTANADYSLSAYTSSDQVFSTIRTNVGVSLPIGRKTVFNALQTFNYSPYYNFGLFPALDPALDPSLGGAIVPNIDYAALSVQTYRYGVTTQISRPVSRRASINLSYGARYTDFHGGAAQGDLVNQHAAVRYNHSLAQSVSLRLGYGYSNGAYATNATRETHDIDVGIDYSKALSFLRRATVGFTTGSTLMARGPTPSLAASGPMDFRLTGSANLDYQLYRTWSTRLSYRRGWNFVDGFADPLFNDAVTLAVGGDLNRRTTAGVTASYLHGTLGFTGQGHDSFNGTSMIRVALPASSSVYAQYVYYRYEFPNRTSLQTGFPAFFARNGVRVGFSFGIPLFGQ